MTLTVGFPSADFPGPPPFRFEMPEGWRAVPSLQADAVVVSSEETDGVRPNVVITNHKVMATADPPGILKEMVDRQLSRDEVIANRADIDLDESDGRSCSVRFTRLVPSVDVAEDERAAADAETADLIAVEQSLNLCYIDGPHVAYVLAATGTYAPGSESDRALVDTVVGSVKY